MKKIMAVMIIISLIVGASSVLAEDIILVGEADQGMGRHQRQD